MDTRVSENEVFQSEFRLAAAYYAYKIAAQGVGFELTEDASHPLIPYGSSLPRWCQQLLR